MDSSTAPASPVSLPCRGSSKRIIGRHGDKRRTTYSEFSGCYDGIRSHRRFHKSLCSLTSMRSSEETLDDDNPEDRRIAAALLRRHVTFEDQRQKGVEDVTSVDSTTVPSKHSCRMSLGSTEQEFSPRSSNALNEEREDSFCSTVLSSRSRSYTSTTGSRLFSDDENEDDDVDDDDDVDADESEQSGSVAGKVCSETDANALFWLELEGLKEENEALRHESEVHRLRGQLTALKLQLQELMSFIFYRTAFGLQPCQMDHNIQSVIDEAWSRAILSLRDMFDIPAFVFEYTDELPPSPERTAAHESLSGNITHCDSTPGDCKSGYGHFDGRCKLVGMSRAAEFLTGRELADEQGASWLALFARESPADINNVLRVRKWVNDVNKRLDNVNLEGSLALLDEKRLLQDGEFLRRLRLDHKTGCLVSGSMLLTTFLVANRRLFILGVHSSVIHSVDRHPDQQQPSYNHHPRHHRTSSQSRRSQDQHASEIRLRRNLLSVFGRMSGVVIETLKVAQDLLTRSRPNLNHDDVHRPYETYPWHSL